MSYLVIGVLRGIADVASFLQGDRNEKNYLVLPLRPFYLQELQVLFPLRSSVSLISGPPRTYATRTLKLLPVK
jgi:hypothetical protein